jgi:hypothetical protein
VDNAGIFAWVQLTFISVADIACIAIRRRVLPPCDLAHCGTAFTLSI